jgi:hypothetical protein
MDKEDAPRPFIRPNFAFLLDGGGLFPFHATPFTAYCANIVLDPLPQPSSPEPRRLSSNSGTLHPNLVRYDIRVLRLKFKNSAAITWFREWVYHQDCNILRRALMPYNNVASQSSMDQLKLSPRARYELANEISSAYTVSPRLSLLSLRSS